MKKLGILYICTGKYKIFWKDFYESSEKYFFKDTDIMKHYFVFTDANTLEYETDDKIHMIYQKNLPWPYITLYRFKIFNKIKEKLKKMDYIYFFNANLLFVDFIGYEILPDKNKPLVMVKHPGYYNKNREKFPYEKNNRSLAYIRSNEGNNYFMGGLNGGIAIEYLKLIDILEKRIDLDKKNGIIAIWHDESHLNRYAIDVYNKIKILEPSYGYPEGWELPFKPKILIRDKNKYGGHNFLRIQKSKWKIVAKKWLKKLL